MKSSVVFLFVTVDILLNMWWNLLGFKGAKIFKGPLAETA